MRAKISCHEIYCNMLHQKHAKMDACMNGYKGPHAENKNPVMILAVGGHVKITVPDKKTAQAAKPLNVLN